MNTLSNYFFKYVLFSILLLNSDLCLSQITDVLSYRNIGPTRGGRVTAVAGITNQPNTFYMGATGGGLWKTKDYGTSWQNVLMD